MRIFSKNPKGYGRLLLPAVLAMAVFAVARFALAPVFGVTQGPLERLVSMTTVLLVSLIAYGIRLGFRDGRIGDVPVVAFGLSVAMTVLIALALGASSALGVDNAYLDPIHLGKKADVGEHMLAHVGMIPILTGLASVIAGVAFGLGRLGRLIRSRVGATA